jgi:hypothetical protein
MYMALHSHEILYIPVAYGLQIPWAYLRTLCVMGGGRYNANPEDRECMTLQNVGNTVNFHISPSKNKRKTGLTIQLNPYESPK